MADELYAIATMKMFAIRSLDKSISDRKTIMNVRYLLEKQALGRQILEALNPWLQASGVLAEERSAVDATIIDAPSSTKNK
jgi:IS5 family transposase